MIREFDVFNNVRRGKIWNILNQSSLVVGEFMKKDGGRKGFSIYVENGESVEHPE